MRIVSWNIRAGGGRRIEAIEAQLARWAPDIVVLSEFRATPPSRWLAEVLAARGLAFQRSTARPHLPAMNALLVASRWPLRRLGLRRGPAEPARWLPLRVAAPRPLALGAMHVPNRVSGRKDAYLDGALAVARRWRAGPGVLVGDTNTGRAGLDEETRVFGPVEDGWMRALDRAGWADAFRHLHGEARAYTWYSPNGRNGFRLDEAFVNRSLLPRLLATRHAWGDADIGGVRREALSDHAALILDLHDGPPPAAASSPDDA